MSGQFYMANHGYCSKYAKRIVTYHVVALQKSTNILNNHTIEIPPTPTFTFYPPNNFYFLQLITTMLTRSKVKMEQSIRHTQDGPYFSEEEYMPSHMYKNPRSNASRNEIIKELRQQYEILKNLSVEDTQYGYGKRYEQDAVKLSSGSSMTSSVHSKKSSKYKEVNLDSPKTNHRELQSIHLQKKQLEIVIGNSMRKIQELLNNQIILKKTIHELKNQIQGRGGVHEEYEKVIRNMQRNEDEMQAELDKIQTDNERAERKIKELGEKIRLLEGEITNKDREIKQGFEEQKKLHELLRIQKDRHLNIEIQCKTYKMEFQLLKKQKDNDINRLIRQFQTKECGNDKEMAFIIKKLEEEIKEKDKKLHEVIIERQQYKNMKDNVVVIEEKKEDKSYIEEMMYKSREINDQNTRALADSVTLIYNKMAEIEKKNQEALKKEVQALRRKHEDKKKNNSSNDTELFARIADFERLLEKERSDKERLIQDLRNAEQSVLELKLQNKELQKKVKVLQESQAELKDQLQQIQQQLEAANGHVNITHGKHLQLHEEIAAYNNKISTMQAEIEGHRQYVNTLSSSFKDKEKKYEDEIRVLRRKVDETEFQHEKTKKEAEFNLGLLKMEFQTERKRFNEERVKVGQKKNEVEVNTSTTITTLQGKIRAKEEELRTVWANLENLRQKSQEDLINQRKFYEERLIMLETRYSQDIKMYNEKCIAFTSANERLHSQLSIYAAKESQLLQLRHHLRQSTTLTTGISHLWSIKQAEYQNINDLLNSLKVA